MRIVAKNWENNSNKIKELENRIITKIWSIIISSLTARRTKPLTACASVPDPPFNTRGGVPQTNIIVHGS